MSKIIEVKDQVELKIEVQRSDIEDLEFSWKDTERTILFYERNQA